MSGTRPRQLRAWAARWGACACVCEWERKEKTEMEMGWEGLGEGTKEGGRRMTGRGMNDGDEWETQTVTRSSRTIVRARPPATMTGVRTCE